MHPAGTLPRECDPIARAPKELTFVVHEAPERAAHALLRPPHLTAFPRFRVGDPDRPWLRFASRLRGPLSRCGRHSDECNATSVHRPNRFLVTIERGVEEE